MTKREFIKQYIADCAEIALAVASGIPLGRTDLSPSQIAAAAVAGFGAVSAAMVGEAGGFDEEEGSEH